MKHNHSNGLIILRIFSLLGFCSCLMPSTLSNDSYNSTTFIYPTPASPFNVQPMENLKSSLRTARRASGTSNSCITNDGASGTCMSRFNCMRLGGTAKGFCATFGGICCETNLQCGQTSRLKRTIIRNPTQLPSTDCFYEIEAYNSNVCQLLVEFENFELLQPTLTDSNLECTDYMQIDEYKLCGVNSQQHLYIPFNVANVISSIPLVFHIPSRWTQTNWRLVVTQLECPAVKRRLNLSFLPFITDNSLKDARTAISTHHSDLDLLAPPGCNQYFRQTTGTIKTFNYNENIDEYYMQNMKYTICIKASTGATMVEYTVRRFSLSIETPGDTGYDNNCHPTIATADRREDYLQIPQGVLANTDFIRPTYYCGNSLDQGSVILASAPFIMHFSSDGQTDVRETGFSIDYRVKSVIS